MLAIELVERRSGTIAKMNPKNPTRAAVNARTLEDGR